MLKVDNSLYCVLSKIDPDFTKYWSKSFFAKFINLKNTRLYFSEPTNKGYIIFSYTRFEIEIVSIFINFKYRRLGIASTLLEQVKEFAIKNKILRIVLEVSVENNIAMVLYKRFGFIEVGIRKNYYKKKNKLIDAKIMSYSI
tara:strand:- start:257 stop:682 length:426 start_codon:yes stop_codon:yes gene_type:complete